MDGICPHCGEVSEKRSLSMYFYLHIQLFFYFQYYKMLQKHILYQHEKNKPWKCDECDYATADKDKLRSHKKAIHEGVLYHCDYPSCSKNYNKKGNLDAHKFRVHKIPTPKAKHLDQCQNRSL